MSEEIKKISKVRLSGENYEIYARLASAIDPNGGFVVSSVPELSALSGSLSGQIFNGSAIYDIVSALETQITAAAEGAVLSHDLFTTTAVGYIPKGKTISAGTSLESIWTSALSQYVKPSVTVSIAPSTTTYAYPETATITGITANVTNGTKNVTSVSFIETDNTKAVSDIIGFEKKGTVTSAISVTANADTSFSVTASDGDQSVTASESISFVWPYFHGVSDTNEPDLSTKPNKETVSQSERTYSFELVGYYYIAYDAEYANLTSIKDNGGNGDETFQNWEKVTTAYEGHTYKMYITKESKAAAGTFKFK